MKQAEGRLLNFLDAAPDALIAITNEVTNTLVRTSFSANARVPEQTLGDLHANLACTEVGGRLLLEFMDECGLEDLAPIADAIVERSERAMRAEIREIPDGVYRNRLQLEGGRDQPNTRLSSRGEAGDAPGARGVPGARSDRLSACRR